MHRARRNRLLATVHHSLGCGTARRRDVEHQDTDDRWRRIRWIHPHRRPLVPAHHRPLGPHLCEDEFRLGPSGARLCLGCQRCRAAQPCFRCQSLCARSGHGHCHRFLWQAACPPLPHRTLQRRTLRTGGHPKLPQGLRRRDRHGARDEPAGASDQPGSDTAAPRFLEARKLVEPGKDRPVRQGRGTGLRWPRRPQGRHHRQCGRLPLRANGPAVHRRRQRQLPHCGADRIGTADLCTERRAGDRVARRARLPRLWARRRGDLGLGGLRIRPQLRGAGLVQLHGSPGRRTPGGRQSQCRPAGPRPHAVPVPVPAPGPHDRRERSRSLRLRGQRRQAAGLVWHGRHLRLGLPHGGLPG